MFGGELIRCTFPHPLATLPRQAQPVDGVFNECNFQIIAGLADEHEPVGFSFRSGYGFLMACHGERLTGVINVPKEV